MIFLFTEIDHPAVFKGRGKPEADQVLASQYFLLEEILAAHGVFWMQRTTTGVLAIFEGGKPAQASIAIQKSFISRFWEPFGPGKIRVVLHSGEAEQYGQSYVGTDFNHALKLLETAWGGQILLTVPAVHFIPLPSGARLQDLGVHFLKDLSEPANVYALQHPDLPPEEHPPLRSLQVYSQNFSPQLSPFYGRLEEIGELEQMLVHSPVRLVTLVGPGGFGKTRLAYQTAAEVVDKFRDGVYWVSLAPVLSSESIVSVIASALKLIFYGSEDPKNHLLGRLKPMECLIVLDNFEHLIEGAGLIQEILGAAPGVKILVTSRESLGAGAERVFEVRGLRYPENEQEGQWEAYSAVQLFLKSARKIRPDFSLDAENGPALIRICGLLEGMPLGLELAATWVSSLPLGMIADKIQSSRDFLDTPMTHLPPRHRSLRAVFEYSWILLSESQKKTLMGISVFRDGFDLPAARKVTGATEPILGLFERKSLVRRRSDGRYEIHELLKHFAKEKLFDDPVLMEKTQDAHCAYFAGLLAKREKGLLGPHQRNVLEELIREMGNIRVGWARAVETGRVKEMGQYVDGLFTLFDTKGWFQDGVALFQEAAEILLEKYPDPAGMPKPAAILLGKFLSRRGDFEAFLGHTQKAQKLFEDALKLWENASARKQSGFALAGLGIVAEIQSEFKKAWDYYAKSYQAYRKSAQRSGITLALNHLGQMAARLGNRKKALALMRKSLTYSKKDKDRREMGFSYALIGEVLFDLGQYQEARAHFLMSLDAYTQSDDRRGISWALKNLGREAEVVGDYKGALQVYKESMAIAQNLGDSRSIASLKNQLGYVNWSLGEYQDSARLFGEGLALFNEIGDTLGEVWSLDLLANLRLAQGDDRGAEEYYRRSYDLHLKTGLDDDSQGWHFFHLAALTSFRGQWNEAKNLFLKSLGYFEKTEDIIGEAIVYTHLGETACHLKNLPESEKYFRQAARLVLRSKLTPQLVNLATGVARLLEAQGDGRQALGFLLAALAHPTCRRQSKDMAAPFVKELQAQFTPEQWEGALLWGKTADIEGMIAAWAASDRSPRRRKKSKAHPQKARKPKTKKRK